MTAEDARRSPNLFVAATLLALSIAKITPPGPSGSDRREQAVDREVRWSPFAKVMHAQAGSGRKRILVVEDEFVLAADTCAKIEASGGVIVGPVSTLAGGHALLQTSPQPEGGILDIRIGDDMVYPLADDLMAVGVPIMLASSESKAAIPSKYATVPLIGKPISMMLAVGKLFPAF